MLPNWIYYFIGKKSGGDTPTPPEPPPTGDKFKLVNGISFRGTSLEYFPDSFGNTIDVSELTSIAYMFAECVYLVEPPLFDTSNVTTMTHVFDNCTSLTTIPAYNTSKCERFGRFCYVGNLTNVPVLDMSSVSDYNDYGQAFGNNNCTTLTDTSLDNILVSLMTITDPRVSSSKKQLSRAIANYSYYSSRIPNLPHYQAFLDAGWTIS